MNTPMEQLRPIERRVLKMRDDGMAIDSIAERFKRSPGFVERVISWTEIPRSGTRPDRVLRPLEKRVLDMRAAGESHDEIGRRFKKTARFIQQVEGLAHFKESQRLLGG
jgi:DNA-binding CsgD family transcriptional regulator